MKLIRAKFNNFRLLKDVELDFATDSEKRLTVIRAANETGKTTTLTALIWALYGSKAVARKNGLYSATALDDDGNGEVDISVEVEFVTEEIIDERGSAKLEERHYRLIRKCTEVVKKNTFQRIKEGQSLFIVKPTGDDRVLESEVPKIIEKALPKNLKDIYFTDGDSAMSFIEASADTRIKRKRVQSAIESLLSMDKVKDLLTKLEKVRSSFGRQIEKGDLAEDLASKNEQREDIALFLEGEAEELNEYHENRKELEKELDQVKKKIEETLKLGDRQKLLSDIQTQIKEKSRLEQLHQRSKQRLSDILITNKLASYLIKDKVSPAIEILQTLRNNKQLPKQSIPVLSELLEAKNCFCGAELTIDTDEGIARRRFIQEKIDQSEESDKLNAAATELFYAFQGDPLKKGNSEMWLTDYEKCVQDETQLSKQLQETQNYIERLEEDVSKIKDDFLQGLKKQEKLLSGKIRDLNMDIARSNQEIEAKQEQLSTLKAEIDVLTKKLDKKDNSSGKYKLTNDLHTIFANVFENIKTKELEKVSEEMNEIFLSMIGSDPIANPNTMIQSAKLTDKFDIKVFGINGHELDPDQDLNGASRRAITLAFILALTKVSKVDAANIIDTPLGMMSGYVKRSVLTNLIKESKQVILFLTHSEIVDVEDIIDEYAGEIYTLTNPGHYPLQLLNKPPIEKAEVLRCSCNHREVCNLCERKVGETV